MDQNPNKPSLIPTGVPVPKPASPAPTAATGQIAEVTADEDKSIKSKYYKKLMWVGIVLLVLELILVAYMLITVQSSGGGWFLAIIPVLIFLGYYSYIRNKIEDAFFQQYATLNGFTFQKRGLPADLDGQLFNIGHSRIGTDLVAGSFQNLPLDLFNYRYTIGGGKNQETFYYTVFRLQYSTPLPPLMLQLKWHNFGVNIFSMFSSNGPVKINLEGDFDKYFTLYARKGFETEALEIFTPDFMAKIQNTWKHFSLEFIHNHIYIYCNHTIRSRAELDSISEMAQFLVSKVGPMVGRMKTTLTELESYYAGQKSI
jgi:hypothetical protein